MKADFALNYDVLTVEQPHKLYLMARLVADPAPDSHKRRPLNLCLVIDRSGSMAGDKIEFTRQAAQFLVQHLGSADYFSIVLYTENVETLLPPEPVIRKDFIVQRLQKIRAGGMTNLSGGWLQGCSLVAQNVRDDYINRVILMSDGLANRGIIDERQLVTMAREKRNQNVTTTAMGLGADFNEELLMAMADAGGGAFYFIESPESTPLIFQEELRGLLSVVGQNLTVRLEVSENISNVSQLNAYDLHLNGNLYTFSLGDVYGDELKTLVLELDVPALTNIGEREIARLRFEYDAITESGSDRQMIELPIKINIVAEQAVLPAPNPEVGKSVLLLQSARARREAIKAADKSDFQSASQILRQAATAIEDSRLVHPELLDEQQSLLQQAAEMERGNEFYDDYSRKVMTAQSNYTMTDKHERTVSLRAREIERALQMPEVEKKQGVPPRFMSWREQTIPLQESLIRIGRAPQNEIVLNGKNISRFHCQVKPDGAKVFIEDLGSTNGTFVNGMRITEPHVLSVGDVVRIGYEQLIFHDHG
jgi:Ca-activated chloride channel family protein